MRCRNANGLNEVFLSIVSLVIGLLCITARVSGQSLAKDGEWSTYNADLAGTRYRPLDQINAANFSELEVAWRFKTDNLGPFPEYKLEGTPLMVNGVIYTTGGTRRSVIALDAKTGELIWVHSMREGKRAAVSPRQLSGRGVAYWTNGNGDERVIYVTTGYRLIELNAKTGAMITSFGTNGVLDLKVGVMKGVDQPIDLETGEIGMHSTPIVVKDVVIVGSSMKEGQTVETHNNTKGLVRAFDVRTGKKIWQFNYDAKAGRIRQRYLGGRFVGHQRQHRRLDPVHCGRRPRVGVLAGGRPYIGLLWRASAWEQPVWRQLGLRRSKNRTAQVAFPIGAPSHLEL
jgi:quinoprotein glucose dehydrogenase